MTQKLRKKHGLPEESAATSDGGRRNDHPEARMDEAMRRMRDMPGMGDRMDRDRMDRMDRMDRIDRMGGRHDPMDDYHGGRRPRHDMDHYGRGRRFDDEDDHREEEDHHIGKTRELTFTEPGSIGLHISREWGHSHFLVDKVTGQAEKNGAKVGEVVAAVNGRKVRWKNLQQLQDMIKNAGRPVKVTLGEHRPDGMFGGRHREL